jgi:hypothetical protein
MIKEFKYFINENKTGIRFFFDMDDVLCDFTKSIKSDYNITNERKILKKYLSENYPDFYYSELADVKLLLKKVEDKTLSEMFFKLKKRVSETASQKGFFENLEIKDGAKKMLIEAKKISGRSPDILTACVASKWCEPEKKIWLDKNLNGYYNNFYCTKEKEIYAAPNHVLIDDRLIYITNFKKAGGIGILYTNSTDVVSKMHTL